MDPGLCSTTSRTSGIGDHLHRGTRPRYSPWQAQRDRYVLFYKYIPGHMVLGNDSRDERTRLLTVEQKRYVVPSAV